MIGASPTSSYSITASFAETSSYAPAHVSASYATTSSYADNGGGGGAGVFGGDFSGSFSGSVTGTLVGLAESASRASTSSYITGSIKFPDGLVVTGSTVIDGTMTANTGSFLGSMNLSMGSEPADPAASSSVMWLSNGTGTGSLGDLVIKVHNGLEVRSGTLFVFGDWAP